MQRKRPSARAAGRTGPVARRSSGPRMPASAHADPACGKASPQSLGRRGMLSDAPRALLGTRSVSAAALFQTHLQRAPISEQSRPYLPDKLKQTHLSQHWLPIATRSAANVARGGGIFMVLQASPARNITVPVFGNAADARTLPGSANLWHRPLRRRLTRSAQGQALEIVGCTRQLHKLLLRKRCGVTSFSERLRLEPHR